MFGAKEGNLKGLVVGDVLEDSRFKLKWRMLVVFKSSEIVATAKGVARTSPSFPS